MLAPTARALAIRLRTGWASRSMRVTLAALGCLVLAVVAYWSVLLDGQRNQQREVEQQTRLRIGQMALAVSVQVQTLLSGLDYMLQSLATLYVARDYQAFADDIQSVKDVYPPGAVTQIAVANAAGEIVYSSLEPDGHPQSQVSIHDREHFLVHANGQVEGMHVSRPVQGRVSQRWSIQLTRAIEHDGTFLGVLVLSLSPDHIARYFQALSADTGDVITLLRADGAYLARSQRQDQVLGTSLPAEPGRHLAPGVAAGFYSLVSPVDGVERVYGWSRVAGQPLVASVGLDQKKVLGLLQSQTRRVLLRNGVASLLLLLGGVVAAWLALQRQRSELLRQRGERRFALLAQEAPGGLFQCRMDEGGKLQLLFSTPQFHTLHGLPATAGGVRTRALVERVWPGDLRALIASVRASLATPSSWEHRYRVRGDEDGSPVRWLHSHARMLREDDGTPLWHGYVHDVTQDQLLREAVRHSEERLRLTVRAARDGLWEWECDTGRVRGDERCAEILGHAPQPMALDTAGVRALVHPADLPRLAERLRRHVDAGDEFRVEVRLRTATGGWRSVEVRGEVTQRGAQGQPLRMLGMQSDIHQRVEQGRLIHALLDKGSALVLVVTPAGDIVYANERAAVAFGLPAGAQQARPSVRALHPGDDSFARFCALQRSMRAQASMRMEWLLRLADGSAHWFDIQGAPLDPQDEGGDVIWTLVDIDARRRAESALHETRRTLGAIIDRFPAGILVVDAHGGQVVAANEELVEVLRLPQACTALVGMPLAQLRTLVPEPLARAMLGSGAAGEGFPQGKSVQTLADGRFLEVEALALAEQGQAMGHCWVVNDVTERRQRETRLETLALTDALTGVPNRRAFTERLDTEIRHLQAGLVHRAALLMLDIDHFKRVNDTWGHAVGDVVLRELAQAIAGALRKDDMVGRIGGEEFAVLLSGASTPVAHERAEGLRRAIEGREIRLADGTLLRITVSLGVYGLDARDGCGEQGLERADAAMYFSKRSGRNQTTVWRADLPGLAPQDGRGGVASTDPPPAQG